MIVEENGKRVRKKGFDLYKIKGFRGYLLQYLPYGDLEGAPVIFNLAGEVHLGVFAVRDRRCLTAVSWRRIPDSVKVKVLNTINDFEAGADALDLGGPFLFCSVCGEHYDAHENKLCLFEPGSFTSPETQGTL